MATPAAATLTIEQFTFSALTVSAGATVTVMNKDSQTHTVTVAGTTLDVNVPAGGKSTFAAPATAGAYPLTCDFHGNMHGTLTVTS